MHLVRQRPEARGNGTTALAKGSAFGSSVPSLPHPALCQKQMWEQQLRMLTPPTPAHTLFPGPAVWVAQAHIQALEQQTHSGVQLALPIPGTLRSPATRSGPCLPATRGCVREKRPGVPDSCCHGDAEPPSPPPLPLAGSPPPLFSP